MTYMRRYRDDSAIIAKLERVRQGLERYFKDLGRFLRGGNIPNEERTAMMKVLTPVRNTIQKVKLTIKLVKAGTHGDPAKLIGAAIVAATALIPLGIAAYKYKQNSQKYGQWHNGQFKMGNAYDEVFDTSKTILKDVSNKLKHNATRMKPGEENNFGGETIDIGDSACRRARDSVCRRARKTIDSALRRAYRRHIDDEIEAIVPKVDSTLTKFINSVKTNTPKLLNKINPLRILKKKLNEFYVKRWQNMDLSKLILMIVSAIAAVSAWISVAKLAKGVKADEFLAKTLKEQLKLLLAKVKLLLAKGKAKGKNVGMGGSGYSYGADKNGEFINVEEGGYSVS